MGLHISVGLLAELKANGDDEVISDELEKFAELNVALAVAGLPNSSWSSGSRIRRRCLSTPTDHQQLLLDRLKLRLPKINQTEM